ncbi:agmatine/peptidylarginine deiminase [Vogesella sp. LIG4]|uniref:agmatine deiminase family protein n=1 Tax=Vogesella sp. LIG4 TaxID=1192162 RepID=UPI00082017ED|nr:agmatine deiminase family protein [Vogesella sp. LIG4]SCK27557.1 agmatine deiminase [Vogesella sp. LIG4]
MNINTFSGFRMPGEFEPHAACLMAWPGKPVAWDGFTLDAVQQDYLRVARAIRQFEPVTFVVDPSAEREARNRLGSDFDIITLPLAEAWFRDTGPSFVKQQDGSLAGVCWRFNGWGNYSPDYAADTMLARRLLAAKDLPAISSALAMEGGALHVDGQGTLLTTETVVLNNNRNPGMTREAAEAEFQRTLGIEKTIWLPGSHLEKGTDGHIDGIACFVRPGVVLFETSSSCRPAYAGITQRNLAALQGQVDAQGRQLDILFVAEAPDQRSLSHQAWGYSTSYINCYLANGAVVMPKFGIPEDAPAFDAISAAFPDRTVVQVDISVLAAGGGGIHCITQQIPG